MRCPNCGLDVIDKSSFCNHCGTPLTDQGKMQQVSVANAPLAQAGAQTAKVTPADQPPETILWEEYPSFRTAVPLLVGTAVGYLIIAVILSILMRSHATAMIWGVKWPEFVLFVLFVIGELSILGGFLARLRSLRYRLSTQRLFLERGLLNKRTDEVELEKYKDIFVNQDFWDRLMGCGDVRVITGDVTNQTIEIVDVKDPVRKKELIRKAARDRQAALGIIRREDL